MSDYSSITATRMTTDDDMNRAFGATVGREVSVDKARALKSEHSPIRCLWYWIEMPAVPQRVVNHLTRHKIGIEWFVSTSRPDRVAEQPDMRSMCCMVNAQALIAISRTRLCAKAWGDTRSVWVGVREAVRRVDPELAQAMVPNCLYRGSCPEMVPCGQHVRFTEAMAEAEAPSSSKMFRDLHDEGRPYRDAFRNIMNVKHRNR